MKLIVGPGVYICDECVGLCTEILDEDLTGAPSVEPTGLTDERLAKWAQWIDGAIKNSVGTMRLRRDAWTDVSRIVHENDELPASYWWEFMVDTYIVTQAVAVRRQAAAHRDVASLGRLVLEILDDASNLTRKWWTDLWPKDASMRMDAERHWNTHFAGSIGRHLDPAIPAADLDVLRAAATKVNGYVDQHIAHADASAVPTSVTVTADEIAGVIDTIDALFERYYNLLTASLWSSRFPPMEHDWTAIFREPWMRSHSA